MPSYMSVHVSSEVLANRHGPSPDHASQSSVLAPRAEKDETMKDLMGASIIIKAARPAVFGETRRAASQL